MSMPRRHRLTKRILYGVLSAVLFSANSGVAQTASKDAAPYDLQFIDMTHHHHMDGIAMTKHEEAHGQIGEVKALAARIRAGQEKDVPTLQGIRKRLYGDRPMLMDATVSGMSMKAMQAKSQADMKKLMSAAKQTDPVFVALMIEHHQMAIKMGQDAVKRAGDAELKTFAQQMVATQTKELKELETHRGHGAEDHGKMDHGKK